MNENMKKTRGMYCAAGLISAAGAAVFLWAGLMVREMMPLDERLSGHAAGIYLYIAGAALPCALAVGMLAAVIHEIGQGRAFSAGNVKWMRGIAGTAFLECAYIAAGVIGWSIAGLMHPGVVLLALVLMMLGAGIGILAHSLAGLIHKASEIQQENDLTV